MTKSYAMSTEKAQAMFVRNENWLLVMKEL